MKIKALISTSVAAALAASAMALTASAASFTKIADVGVNHFDMPHVSGSVNFVKTSFDSGSLSISFAPLFAELKDDAIDAGSLDKTDRKLALANITLNGAPINGTSSKVYSTDTLGTLNFGLSSDSGNIARGNYTAFTFGASAVIFEDTNKDGRYDKGEEVDKDETQKLADYLKEEGVEYDRAVIVTANSGRIFDNTDNPGVGDSYSFTNPANGGGKVEIPKIKFDGTQTGDAGEAAQQVVTFDFRSNVSDNLKFTTAEKAVLRKIHTVELDLGVRGASTSDKTVKVELVPKDDPSDVRTIAYAVVPKGASSLTITLPAKEFYDERYGDIFDGKVEVSNGVSNSASIKFTSAKLLFADAGTASNNDSTDVSGKSESEAASLTTAATTTPAPVEGTEGEPVVDEPSVEDEGTDTDTDTDNEFDDGGSSSKTDEVPEHDGGDNSGFADGDDTDAGAGTTDNGAAADAGNNPATGVALAVLPAIVAGAAVVVSRKKK
jgi:hypothetical protein